MQKSGGGTAVPFLHRPITLIVQPVAPSDSPRSRKPVTVQNPRATPARGIAPLWGARPDEAPELEALMAAFGRLRLDVANCVRELVVDFGVIRRLALVYLVRISSIARRY